FLSPGTYKIAAEAPGFKRYLRDNFNVGSGQRESVDISLEVGQVSESVDVTAESPLLETATASAGQVISGRSVANLPMNGRVALVLAQTSIGVISTADPKFSRPFDNAGPSGFSMGGAPAQSNEILVDGSPDTTRNSRVAFNPPVDAVEEVRVHTFEADAAYGHTGGGTVNIVLKGGGNQFHGALYEFNQTSDLAATPFFLNRAGTKADGSKVSPKPITRFNQYGGTASGPVLIPKLFNGKNKLFWFFSYEGIKDSFPEPTVTTVPTAAERMGDFSALLSVGSNYQLYDPKSGVLQANGRIQRMPIPNNKLTGLDPIAVKVLSLYPQPNQAQLASPNGTNNYLSNSVRSDTFDGELGRLDFIFSDKHKMFVNARHNGRVENRGNLFFDQLTGNFLSRINWGSTLDDVYTINPTTVMNVRLNYTRFIEGNTRSSDGFDFTTLGFPASLKAASSKLVFPAFDFNSIQDIGNSGGDVTPFDSYQIFADVVKVMGKHSIKFGTDLRLLRESSSSYGNSSGLYTLRENWTRGPLDNATNAPFGQDVAGFLLGLPTSGSFDINAFRTNQASYMAYFIHDDWRVRSNLTFNIGLRMEKELPEKERWNRTINGFDTTTASPISAAALAAYAKNYAANPATFPISPTDFKVNGGLLFAGPNGTDYYKTSGPYFSPRFGFAWSPKLLGGKTVVRGGVGVFLFALGAPPVLQSGFSASTTFNASQDNFLTATDTLSKPFTIGIQRPTGSSLGLATFLGQNLTIPAVNQINPYSTRWNFDIQRQLGRNLVFEIGYTGNHAVHLPVTHNINFVPRQSLSTSPTRDQATINYLTGLVANPFAGLVPGQSINGGTIARQALLLPYPQFGSTLTLANDPRGSSYFHSVAVRVEKRYSQGLNLLANFTYSKLMDRSRYLNDSDPLPEKRISPDDRPLRMVVSGSYDLPFGHGKRFLSSSGLWDRLFGGFVVNGIYNWQIGAPLNWEGQNALFLGGDLQSDPRNIDRAFDTTRFNTVSTQQLANNVRTFSSRFGN
ncbi:MAG: TonB-dependent receptor, partial [Bryobacteraceae bacterium]